MDSALPTAAEIAEAALKLPYEQRVEIADRLVESLDPPDESPSRAEWLAGWKPEWDRRVRAAEDGSEPAVPFEEAWREIAGLDE